MPDQHPPLALIVSRDDSDALALQSHFRLCSVNAVACNRMDARGDFRRARTVVVFPDDFSAQAAARGVPRLARRFPQAALIVVTMDVAFFEAIAQKLEERAPARIFVLPRPIWGWVLLDRVLSLFRAKPATPGSNSAHTGI